MVLEGTPCASSGYLTTIITEIVHTIYFNHHRLYLLTTEINSTVVISNTRAQVINSTNSRVEDTDVIFVNNKNFELLEEYDLGILCC